MADVLPFREPYEAFRKAEAPIPFLIIRPAGKWAYPIYYEDMPYFFWDDTNYAWIKLHTPAMTVTITGKRLEAPCEALNEETCKRIEIFNPEKFPQPEDTDAPFVESIKIKWHNEVPAELKE
jgi:hypothetical protein